jgi:hypothetical protein
MINLPFLHVDNQSVIFFHSVKNSVSGLWQRKVGFVQLNLVISLLCLKLCDLLFQKMAFQLLAVHFQLVLRVRKFTKQLLHLALLFAVLSHEIIVFAHEPLILASLIRIEFIQSHLHLLVDACQLVLKNFGFLFNFFSLQKDLIELRLKLIILVFDMLVGNFDIFRSGIDPKFIQSQIVISQLPFETSDFSGQTLKSFFEFVIKLLFFVDSLSFVFEFLSFFLNVHHLLFDFGHVIVSVVDFSLSRYSLWTIDTSAGSQWTLLNLDCSADTAQWIQSLN